MLYLGGWQVSSNQKSLMAFHHAVAVVVVVVVVVVACLVSGEVC